MTLDALNKYLEATQDHLGVEDQRYGGGFRAIVAHRSAANFLFDKLEGGDFDGTEAQSFLNETHYSHQRPAKRLKMRCRN